MVGTDGQEGPGPYGPALKRWRQRNRLTQSELAEALGYEVSYIQKIERGVRPPSRAFLSRMSYLSGQSERGSLRGPSGDVARPPLPQPRAPSIGRGALVDAVVGLLLGPARCVTLVGPPGIGKTQVAMDVAARLDAELPDGAWWVPLVDLRSPTEVGARLRRDLAVPSRSSGDPLGAVMAGMRGQRGLVVLDNFEHVMRARTLVSRMIGGTSSLKVLVTSREPLELESEHVVVIPTLDFPDPASQPSLEEIGASTAVGVFVSRAKMAASTFQLTASNCHSVLAACAQMDGLPLAIVLAAGGVKTLNPAGIVARLDEDFELGDFGPSDLPPHHRTLAAAIAWSWNLLSGRERGVLAALASFSGGFGVEAVASVAGIDLERARVVVRDLSRKSLIEARPDADGGPRFEMLHTLGVFARAQLEASGRLPELCQGHARYFSALADYWGRRLVGADQISAVRALTDEFENLRAAFEWNLRFDASRALQMATSLWRFFLLRDIPTGRRWLEASLAHASEPTPARAGALVASGALGWVTGDREVADRCLSEGAALAEELGLPEVMALVLVNRGARAEQQGRLDDAEECFADALVRYERLGDRRGKAVALNGLGMVRRRRERIDEAWPFWVEAAALFRAVGDGANEALVLGNQAWQAEVGGRLDEAEAICNRCRHLQIPLGDARGLAATTAALGRIAFLRGAIGKAKGLHLTALRAFQRLGDLPWMASTLLALGAVSERSGECQRAVQLLGLAEKMWDEMAAQPREEERVLLDGIVDHCRSALGASGYDRALASGRFLTVDEALALLSEPTAQ